MVAVSTCSQQGSEPNLIIQVAIGTLVPKANHKSKVQIQIKVLSYVFPPQGNMLFYFRSLVTLAKVSSQM